MSTRKGFSGTRVHTGLSRRELMKTAACISVGAGAMLARGVDPGAAAAAPTGRSAGAQRVSDAIWAHMPFPEQVPVTEGYADTPLVKLWFWDTGGDGEAIVLCHPGSQSSLIWEYQQPVFARAGYRVIAYSRRGHYRTERGPEDDRGTTVGDLTNLLDFLGVDRAHLVGAAAGGMTAAAYAVAHPDRLHSLVLAGTILGPNEDEWREMYGRLNLSAVRECASTDFLELGPSYRAANPVGSARFVELEHLARPNGSFSQPSGVDVTWQALEQLRVPTLLLVGEADLYAPPSMQRLFSAHLLDPELVILSETGHAAYWEQPEQFNHVVLDFIGNAGAR